VWCPYRDLKIASVTR